MTKILLTGPSGFIGSNYSQFTTNANVECLYKSTSNLNKTKFSLVGNLNDERTLNTIVENNYDFIIHGAWTGLPDLNPHNNQLNFNMYKFIIDRLKKYKNINHIFLGSCLEYGQLTGPVKETDTGIKLNDFAKTKLQILDYVKDSGINFSWLRLFYTFGKNQHDDSLLNYLITCVKNGTEINIKNPNQKHDYIYVKNIISAIDQNILNGVKNNILNLGQGECLSNGNLADIVLEHFKKDKKYSHPLDENSGLFANIQKAETEINWKPNYSVKEAIGELIMESGIHD